MKSFSVVWGFAVGVLMFTSNVHAQASEFTANKEVAEQEQKLTSSIQASCRRIAAEKPLLTKEQERVVAEHCSKFLASQEGVMPVHITEMVEANNAKVAANNSFFGNGSSYSGGYSGGSSQINTFGHIDGNGTFTSTSYMNGRVVNNTRITSSSRVGWTSKIGRSRK